MTPDNGPSWAAEGLDDFAAIAPQRTNNRTHEPWCLESADSPFDLCCGGNLLDGYELDAGEIWACG